MRIYKDLEIWKKASDVVVEVYALTAQLPAHERYSLTNQMRRSAVSLPSNIAEGCSGSDRYFIRYLRIALGSGYELETQLILCFRINYLAEQQVRPVSDKLERLLKMINALITSLNRT